MAALELYYPLGLLLGPFASILFTKIPVYRWSEIRLTTACISIYSLSILECFTGLPRVFEEDLHKNSDSCS